MESGSQSPQVAPLAMSQQAVEKLFSLFKHRPVNTLWKYCDPYKIIPTILFIVVGFWSTLWPAKIAILVAGLAAMLVRDIQIDDAKGTAADAATDGFVMALTIILSQLYFVAKDPKYATLNATELAQGAALSMFLVAGWRMVIYFSTYTNDPTKVPEYKVFVAALRVNGLFMFGALLLALSGSKAVPGGFWRDFLLGMTPIVAMGLSCRYQLKTGRLFFNGTDGTHSLKSEAEPEGPEDRGDVLPQSIFTKSPEAGKVAFFRAMFVASVLATTPIAIWKWLFGDPSNILWGRLLANVVAFAILIPLWRVLVQFNGAVAELLRREALAREIEKQRQEEYAQAGLRTRRGQ